MKPGRVWAVTHKEFLHIIRDPLSLGLAIALPMLLLILFGYALTLDVDQVPMIVWDQSRTPISREFISRFSGSRYFSIRETAAGYRRIEQAVDRNQVLVALIIPTDFAEKVNAGRPAAVQMILDGTDSNTATLALGYAEAVCQTFSENIALTRVNRTAPGILYVPVDPRLRIWYNADLQSRNFIFPGLIAVIMMIIAALLTSLTVAREWECGTMEQLIATPVKGTELILGKLIPYFAIGMLDITLAVLMGQFLFAVPLRGNPALLFATAAIFLPGVLSLGIFVSVITRTQILACQLTMMLTFVPSFLLSGFVFPISNMPKIIQIVTYAIPARYLITLLQGIYLKGVGLHVLWLEGIFLTTFGALMVLLAHFRFKKKLE
jgi:ABC-2 type transport system permease protein